VEHDLDKVSLSDLQLNIMRVLWKNPNSSTAQVVNALRDTRPLAHTTVATVLTRLEKRGLLSTKKDGRQILYAPLLTESQVQRSMVSDLLTSLFKGNAQALLSHLLKEDEIKVEDLDKIRQLIQAKGKPHV
jgi:BlaI family penicillinase repressor